jgi:hypothetical protein
MDTATAVTDNLTSTSDPATRAQHRLGRKGCEDIAAITLGQGCVVIDHFVTTRPSVVALFEAEDPERYLAMLDMVLKVGAGATLHAGARADIEHLAGEVAHLEEAFHSGTNELQARVAVEVEAGLAGFAERVEGLCGTGGVLAGMLDPGAPEGVVARLGDVLRSGLLAERASLAGLFDPRSPMSPLAVFDEQVRALTATVEHLRVDLAAERASGAARAEEAGRGTAKGRSFEAELLGALRSQAKPLGDLVERLGDSAEVDGRKVGDFVSSISASDAGASDLRIVIEAKDARFGLTALKRELAQARERRGAAVGIGVYAAEGLVPTGIAPISELTPVDFAVLYDPTSGDAEALRLCYRLARVIALASARTKRGSALDPEALRVDLADARDRLAALLRLRGELTRLANGVAGGIDSLKASLAEHAKELAGILERMEARLAEVPSGASAPAEDPVGSGGRCAA